MAHPISSSRKLSRALLIVVFAVCVSLTSYLRPALAIDAPSAKFYLSPSSKSYASGSVFSVDLRLAIVNDYVYGARARVLYPSDKVQFISSSPGPSFFVATETGEVSADSLTYGSLTAVRGDVLYSSLSFRVVGAAGSFDISVDPEIDAGSHSYVASGSSGTGMNILGTTTGGSYNILTSDKIAQPTSQTGSQNSLAGGVTNPQTSSSISAISPKTVSNSTLSQNIASASSGLSGPTNTTKASGDAVHRVYSDDKLNIILFTQVFIIIDLIALLLMFFRKKRKHRMIAGSKRKETVAELEKRIKRGDRSKETVAELAARLNADDHTNETVAELAVRVHKNESKAQSSELSRNKKRQN